MDYIKIQFERDYLGGMTFDTHSSRKYKYTIKSKENKTINGKCFYAEMYTERDVNGVYGEGKMTYYVNAQTKEYKSIKWLLKSMNK